jgi:hypothetical protein
MAAIAALLLGRNSFNLRGRLRVLPQLLQARDSLLNLFAPEGLRPGCPVVLPCLAVHGCAPFSIAPDNDSDVTPYPRFT